MDLDPLLLAEPQRGDDLIALDGALEQFQQVNPRKAAFVKLRYFGGLTTDQAAKALGISVATAERDWAYARVWLLRQLSDEETSGPA